MIITKDTDFSDRILVSSPPPKVVRVRTGNLRLAAFHKLLGEAWPAIEVLLENHKLINVYSDRFAAVEDGD